MKELLQAILALELRSSTIPLCRVEELHDLRRNRNRLPRNPWDNDLKNRHFVCPNRPRICVSYWAKCTQVFVVDNSTSMRPHWVPVTELLHSLAYSVKPFARNCINLFYTHGSENIRSWKPTELVRSVERQKPPDSSNRYTDIETSLGRLLDSYMRCIERRYCGVERVLITVFTDGRWQPYSDKNIENTLHRLTSTLRDAKRNPKQICIQFIQFGNDLDAPKRLDHLSKYDMVDTEPADGNGFKMLLGSISKVNGRYPSPSAYSRGGHHSCSHSRSDKGLPKDEKPNQPQQSLSNRTVVLPSANLQALRQEPTYSRPSRRALAILVKLKRSVQTLVGLQSRCSWN